MSNDMSESPLSATPSSDDSVASLRGPAAVGVGRRFWLVVGAMGLVIVAATLVVTFVSAANDNSRVSRLKDHGIAVVVSVDTCIGNLGGSGSNASSYTCTGTYVARATTYHEVIGAMSFFATPGTRERAVADPARPSTVELASAVSSSHASNGRFIVPGLLAVALLTMILSFVRLLRRPTATSPLS